MSTVPLLRRSLAEFVGTGLLVAVVVGSGIAATRLSPDDVGLLLLENSLATALGLAVLILVFGPVSGAHFNPVVSAVDWWLGRRIGGGLTAGDLAAYTVAQVAGGIGGAVLADLMLRCPRWTSPAATGPPGICCWVRWSLPPALSCWSSPWPGPAGPRWRRRR